MVKLTKLAGKLCARFASLERAVVWTGHKYPKNRLVRSLCYNTGDQIFLQQPDNSDRIAVLENGMLIGLSLQEHSWRQTYFHGVQEEAITSLIKHIGKPDQVWLDLGANIGYFTLILSKLIKNTGQVYAFEPNPTVTKRILQSLNLNSCTNVTLFQLAVTNKNTLVPFYLPLEQRVPNSGRASLILHSDFEDYEEVQVPAVVLDQFLTQSLLRPIDFVKADIEGAEFLAFKGMEQILTNMPPKIIISEISHYKDCYAQPNQLIDYLCEFGYQPYHLRINGLSAYSKLEPLNSELDKDIVFVQPAALSLVQSLVQGAN